MNVLKFTTDLHRGLNRGSFLSRFHRLLCQRMNVPLQSVVCGWQPKNGQFQEMNFLHFHKLQIIVQLAKPL